MMECKHALQEAGGSIESAIEALRIKGAAKAGKKAGRETAEGRVATYVHPGDKIGVMIEVNCETDFAARNEEFGVLVRDLCMHIAAASPEVVQREDIEESRLEKERKIFLAQAREMGKPEKVIDKIVDGMVDKWCSEICLLEQPFIKEPKITVRDHLTAAIAKIGENMKVRRFARFELGK